MKNRVAKFALILISVSMLVAVFANPAAAQLQPWEDYEASDSVLDVTYVDLDPGTMGIYLEGLKATWLAANKVAKELGHIEDYSIYANQYGSGDTFDLVLVIKMASTADIAPNRERYNEFMAAWGEANRDMSNEKVLELYNKIRRIQGNYLLREITVK